jgi:HK97 family phage major capsid protein
MAQVDIRRGTTGVSLPPSISSEIWSNVLEASAVMQAANTIALPGPGLTIPMITGEPTANWVLETEEKPVSRGTVSSKSMTPYTIAVIVPFSNQFKRDASGLYGALVQRLPAALARKFDRTVFGVDAVPGSGFDTLAAAPALTVDSTGTFGDVLAVLGAVATAGFDVTDWIVNQELYSLLLTAVDPQGRQFFTANQAPSGVLASSILGANVLKTKTPFKSSTTLADDTGIAGDWKGAAFVGTVEGVTVSITDTATINDGGTQLNLWQRNMFAVRAEIELGFIYRDINAFVRVQNPTVDTP